MRRFARGRRAFALVAVISVLALLLIYLAAVQGAAGQTVRMQEVTRGRAESARVVAAAAALATLAEAPLRERQRIEVAPGRAVEVEVNLRPLAADDPIWGSLPGLAARPGDVLLEASWKDQSLPQRALINLEGRRRGMIRLPAE